MVSRSSQDRTGVDNEILAGDVVAAGADKMQHQGADLARFDQSA
jgi:hypothetical protein